MLTITVHYFAMLREDRGVDSESLSVPEGTTAEQVFTTLFGQGPLRALRVAFSINQRYAKRDDRLKEGDALGLLPPLGGG